MSPARRFSLLDAMILIAAIAPGMMLGKAYFRCAPALSYLVSGEHRRQPLPWWDWPCAVVPTLAAVTLALLPLRRKAPQPPAGRVFLVPGTTATLVAVLAWGVVVARALGDWPTMERVHFPVFGTVGPAGLLALRVVGMKDLVGPGVAVAWGLLWLGGGWRPEGTWTDRAGRLLGFVWIALALASWIIGWSD